MSDIALIFDAELGSFDLQIAEGQDLLGDAGLQTAVMISLFTDARAKNDDPLPDSRVGVPSDLRGFWGDVLLAPLQVSGQGSLGSRLWLLHREKEMQTVLARAEEYATEALQWLVDGKHVEGLAVNVLHLGKGHLQINVKALPKPNQSYLQEWQFVYDYANSTPLFH